MHESFSALVTLLKHTWATSLIIAGPVAVVVGILVGLMMLRKSGMNDRKTQSHSLSPGSAEPAKSRRTGGIFWTVVIVIAITDVIATLLWGLIHGR